MRKLRLDGVEIRDSYLTQRSYRAAYCDFLLPVTSKNKKNALEVFKREGEFGKYRGLHVSGVADLSFLKDFPNLLYLEIADQKRVNPRHLDGLTNLRGLRLESPGAGIDFGCFPELEVFVGDWHVDNCNLHQCRELRQLRAWQFNPRSLDLSKLANIPRLEWLAITQTNIASLAGVEMLEDLRYLEVAYAPKLELLDALAFAEIGIRELSLGKAKKISSYRPIASISQLRRLKLSDCASMANLKWVAGMNRLDFFSFVETNVVDGDLTPLLSLPKLQYVGTMDKKHYNYKCNRLNEVLKSPRG